MADPARDGAYSPASSESPPLRVLPAAAPAHGEPHRYLIAFAVVLAALMQVIDSSIVNVALPDMMGNLGASLDEVAWVSTGYILASVIVIPLTGWLGSIFGRKRYFVASIVLFTLASLFCGASHSLAALVFWRIVQGIGGGALMTVSQAVLFEAFPREEAGMAMALFGLGVMVGPTIGPTLGGWLTDNYGWPWIFYINLPVGILAAVMIGTYVHDSLHQQKPPTVDYIGIALLAVSVGAIQYVLEHGQRDDWFDSSLITSLTVTGVLGAILLLWRELTTEHPVIDFRVLRHRQMSVGTLLGVVMGVGLYAMSFTLPVFLQSNLRMTAEQTGIVMLPGAIATALSMFVVGRLIGKVDTRLLILIGLSLTAVSLWEMTGFSLQMGMGPVIVSGLLQGFGLGCTFVPLNTLALSNLPRDLLTQGTALRSVFRNIGGSMGIAILVNQLTSSTQLVHARLVEHLRPDNPLMQAPMLPAPFSLSRPSGVAALNAEVTRQAEMVAYVQDFGLMLLLVLLAMPFLLLVRRPRPRPAAAAE